ncbi:phytase [Acanthocystis turfacea Chlorella virus Br0604L]|nr:phytase [Acanthocystis turfacea Chlorella virus Br0604L]
MTPIALGIHVPEEQTLLLPELYSRETTGDLPCDECFTSHWALVIEQNTVACEHSICLAIVHDRPVRKQLCDCVRRSRMKGSRDLLRDFSNFAEELRC